jgi:hypothetical protein
VVGNEEGSGGGGGGEHTGLEDGRNKEGMKWKIKRE